MISLLIIENYASIPTCECLEGNNVKHSPLPGDIQQDYPQYRLCIRKGRIFTKVEYKKSFWDLPVLYINVSGYGKICLINEY
jgi:hypothetical protein